MTPTTSPAPTPVRLLLAGRFGWFFLGRTIDLAGAAMTPVALALAVLQTSGSAGDLGVVLAANTIPNLVLLLVGGTVADRVSRRSLLITCCLATGTSMAAMSAVLIAGCYHLGVLAVLSLVNGGVGAFTSPALRGIVPELVAQRDLQRANALLASSRNAVRIIAPAVAGVLVSTVGGGWALAVDAVSCVLAAVVFVRVPAGRRAGTDGRGWWRDLSEGWSVFRSLRWVVLMTASYAMINAVNVGPWNIVGPMVVAGDNSAFGWGAVQSARAVGLLLASVLIVRFAVRRPLRTGPLWGTVSALPLLAIGLSGDPLAVAAAAFVGGLGFTVAGTIWETAVQSSVPAPVLSRVTAYDDLFSYLAIPLSQLAVGPLAATLGPKALAVACGIGYLVACLFPFVSRDIRNGTVGQP